MPNDELTINGTPYVGLQTYADEHDMDVKRLRRFVRKSDDNTFTRKWDTRWLIERDAHIELPDASTRGRKRADGRQRFIVYVHPDTDELNQIAGIVGQSNVVDPRERARERRANATTEMEHVA